jgi:chromodomain-helicase-DNA-binding protein 1
MASIPYTNGHTSPVASDAQSPLASPSPSASPGSDTQEPVVNGDSSDEDAPGDDEDVDEEMGEATDSSEDVDAEGEPDGDYDSETPPPEPASPSRARSSTSQDSSRPTKRKAIVEDDIALHPEFYGLRRSVRGLNLYRDFQLTVAQGRARPTRRIVGHLHPVI